MIDFNDAARTQPRKASNRDRSPQPEPAWAGPREPGYRVRIVQAEQALRKADQTRMALEGQLLQRRKLEALGTQAGGLAHDLNNVMGVILALAQGARGERLAQGRLDAALDSIISACERGREVVGDLLRSVRQEPALQAPVALNALAEEVAQWLAPAVLKGTRLVLDLQEGLPPVEGEAGALSQALMNLCVNAVEAMPGGGTLTIRTQAGPQGEARLCVQDTGPGMAQEVARLALEAFFTTKPSGTGLGLSLVAATMKGHGGTVELQTRPGAGTAVCLSFPAPSGPAGPPVAAGRAPLSPRRILLVDDDEHFRSALCPLLASLGHRIEEAPGGLEALRRFEEGLEVDLVLLDLNMPGLSGVETLIQLLALRPGQRVLLATGTEDRDLDRFLGQHPTVARIGKPFRLEELQSRIGELDC